MAKERQGKRGPKPKSLEHLNNDDSSSIAGSSKSEMYDESHRNNENTKAKRSYIKVENKKRDELIEIVEQQGYTIKKAA